MPGTTQPLATTPLAPPVGAPVGAPAGTVDVSDRLARVRADLARAERNLRRARRRDTVGVVVALCATSLSTVVAGSAAAVGRAVGTPNWRVTCALAAILGAVGAIATGLRQSFASGERVSRTAACVGRLRGLEFGLATGGLGPQAADQAYRELLEQYAESFTES